MQKIFDTPGSQTNYAPSDANGKYMETRQHMFIKVSKQLPNPSLPPPAITVCAWSDGEVGLR